MSNSRFSLTKGVKRLLAAAVCVITAMSALPIAVPVAVYAQGDDPAELSAPVEPPPALVCAMAADFEGCDGPVVEISPTLPATLTVRVAMPIMAKATTPQEIKDCVAGRGTTVACQPILKLAAAYQIAYGEMTRVKYFTRNNGQWFGVYVVIPTSSLECQVGWSATSHVDPSRGADIQQGDNYLWCKGNPTQDEFEVFREPDDVHLAQGRMMLHQLGAYDFFEDGSFRWPGHTHNWPTP